MYSTRYVCRWLSDGKCFNFRVENRRTLTEARFGEFRHSEKDEMSQAGEMGSGAKSRRASRPTADSKEEFKACPTPSRTFVTSLSLKAATVAIFAFRIGRIRIKSRFTAERLAILKLLSTLIPRQRIRSQRNFALITATRNQIPLRVTKIRFRAGLWRLARTRFALGSVLCISKTKRLVIALASVWKCLVPVNVRNNLTVLYRRPRVQSALGLWRGV